MGDSQTLDDTARKARESAPAAGAAWRLTGTMGVVIFLAMLPVTMIVPVLSELAERFGAGTFEAHLFMSVNMIGAVVAAPLGGALADRIGRRKPVLVLALLADGACLWGLTQFDALGPLFAVRFVEGAMHILAISTLMALAVDWADPARKGRMMGLIGSSLIFGTACGAPLGGLIGRHDAFAVLIVGAVCSSVGALAALILLRDAPGRRSVARFSDALELLKARKVLLVPYAYAFIDRFCVGVIVSSFVLYLGEVRGMSPGGRGGLLALFLFPFALLCYPAGRLADRAGRVWMMCLGSVGFGLVYATYGLLPAAWLPVAMVVSGVLSAVMFAPNMALCADLASPEQRATAFAGFNMAGSLGFLAGPLVGGVTMVLLADRGHVIGYQSAFVVAGCTEVLCALVSIPWLVQLHRQSRAPVGHRLL